ALGHVLAAAQLHADAADAQLDEDAERPEAEDRQRPAARPEHRRQAGDREDGRPQVEDEDEDQRTDRGQGRLTPASAAAPASGRGPAASRAPAPPGISNTRGSSAG